MPPVGVDDSFDHVEGNVQLLRLLLYLLLLGYLLEVSQLLRHLVPDIPLVCSLLHQSRLLLEPGVQLI